MHWAQEAVRGVQEATDSTETDIQWEQQHMSLLYKIQSRDDVYKSVVKPWFLDEKMMSAMVQLDLT